MIAIVTILKVLNRAWPACARVVARAVVLGLRVSRYGFFAALIPFCCVALFAEGIEWVYLSTAEALATTVLGTLAVFVIFPFYVATLLTLFAMVLAFVLTGLRAPRQPILRSAFNSAAYEERFEVDMSAIGEIARGG